MRLCILCLVLFGLLLAPAAGLAKGVEIDPDGQPAPARGDHTAATPSAAVEDGVAETVRSGVTY